MKMAHEVSVFYKLPDEIVLKIFSFLTGNDLERVSLVSQHFNGLALDGSLWSTIEFDEETNAKFVFNVLRSCASSVKKLVIERQGLMSDNYELSTFSSLLSDMHTLITS